MNIGEWRCMYVLLQKNYRAKKMATRKHAAI